MRVGSKDLLRPVSEPGKRRAEQSRKGKICSFRIPRGPPLSRTLEACETSSNIPGGESCSARTSSKTQVDTEQYSPCKENQLRTCQQQDFWIQYPDPWHGGRSQRRSITLSSGAHVTITQNYGDCEREERPQVCMTLPPRRRPKTMGFD